MDVIAPKLLWIQGRCYRINPSVDIDYNENKNSAEFVGGAGFESLQV